MAVRLSPSYLHPPHPYCCIDRCSATKTCSKLASSLVVPFFFLVSLSQFFYFAFPSCLDRPWPRLGRMKRRPAHPKAVPLRPLLRSLLQPGATPSLRLITKSSARANGLLLSTWIGSPIKPFNRPGNFDTGHKLLQQKCHPRPRRRLRRQRL